MTRVKLVWSAGAIVRCPLGRNFLYMEISRHRSEQAALRAALRYHRQLRSRDGSWWGRFDGVWHELSDAANCALRRRNVGL